MMANSAQLLNSIAEMEKNRMPRYRFASSCRAHKGVRVRVRVTDLCQG